jgi:hypothetical protein
MNHDRTRQALFVSLLLSWLAIVVGCQRSAPVAPVSAQPIERAPNVTSATSAPSSPIRIATFNIANLSLHKLAKREVATELVRIVRQYDVVAVQELDDASLRAPQAFLDAINRVAGDRYDVLYSQESGLDASAGEKEQYAVYFNTRTISAVGPGRLYPDQSTKLFVREPFATQ